MRKFHHKLQLNSSTNRAFVNVINNQNNALENTGTMYIRENYNYY